MERGGERWCSDKWREWRRNLSDKERKKGGDCTTGGLDGKHLRLIAPQMVFKAKADGMSD